MLLVKAYRLGLAILALFFESKPATAFVIRESKTKSSWKN
jgi:hypothetical protein